VPAGRYRSGSKSRTAFSLALPALANARSETRRFGVDSTCLFPSALPTDDGRGMGAAADAAQLGPGAHRTAIGVAVAPGGLVGSRDLFDVVYDDVSEGDSPGCELEPDRPESGTEIRRERLLQHGSADGLRQDAQPAELG